MFAWLMMQRTGGVVAGRRQKVRPELIAVGVIVAVEVALEVVLVGARFQGQDRTGTASRRPA